MPEHDEETSDAIRADNTAADKENQAELAELAELAALAGLADTAAGRTPTPDERANEAESRAAEHHDAWLRAKAENENVRRRAQDDIAKASKFAIERFARELLAVKDSLEAALATETPSVDSMKAGTELTLKQLISAFEKANLTEINPLGDKFDPHRHQAISMVDAEQEANTVVSVLQKGYLIADRVLRPALVIVAKPKA